MTATSEAVEAIRRLVEGERRPGDVVSADHLALSPDTHRLAFTATVVGLDGATGPRLAVLDLTTGALTIVDAAESHRPAWSPDGRELAWLTAGPDGRDVVRVGPVDGAATAATTFSAPGSTESVSWSPDGTRLLAGVAAPGAARSDVVGSGTLAPDERHPSWSPTVEDGPPAAGWRHMVVHDRASGRSQALAVRGVNVWQACWAGDHAVLGVVSDGPGESDWYEARLVRMQLSVGTGTGVAMTGLPPGQLAAPAASPGGTRVSVIVGAMSDRGLDSGELWVDGTVVDTLGVDVTWHRWLDDDTVLWAGMRGLRTVIGRLDAQTLMSVETWSSNDTCGGLFPSAAAVGDVVVACVHGHARPPALVRLGTRDETLHALDVREAAVGVTTPRVWTASDGVPIEGLLTQPTTPGPHPLVVLVHGGPVWAWRNTWSMNHPYTAVLVAAGFAVLHPNGRGSSGRGQRFVRDGLTDMGGLDAEDLHRGVDALIAAGEVDAARVAVTGNSYGGFMAAWLPTLSDRFAAAISRSPVTDWITQHHTSNLAGFDRLCFPGEPLAPDSVQRRRSPVYAVDRIRTPMLLTAGARDLGTPASQALELHRALAERGRTSTLVIYPEEGHGVRGREALVDQCRRMREFLGTHLGVTSPA